MHLSFARFSWHLIAIQCMKRLIISSYSIPKCILFLPSIKDIIRSQSKIWTVVKFMLQTSIFLSKLNWSIVFWYSMSKSYLKLVWYPSIRYLVFHLIPQCSIEQPTSIKKLPQYLITKLQLSNDILMVVVERRNNVYMKCYRDFAFAKKRKLRKTIKKDVK